MPPYLVIKTMVNDTARWIDGKALAELFDRPVETPMADYRVTWHQTPVHTLTEQGFNQIIRKKYHSIHRKLFY